MTNRALEAAGKPVLPIQSDQLRRFITDGFVIASSLAAWWKNNSFTPAAIKADQTLKIYQSAGK